jgi:hypothetical protein
MIKFAEGAVCTPDTRNVKEPAVLCPERIEGWPVDRALEPVESLWKNGILGNGTIAEKSVAYPAAGKETGPLVCVTVSDARTNGLFCVAS